MSHLRYTTEVFRSASEIPPPPSGERLAISGVSILLSVAHRVDAAKVAAALADGRLVAITGERSYLDKVRASGLVQTQLLDHGPTPQPVRRVLSNPEEGKLRASLLWLGGDYAMSVIPLVLATDDAIVETGYRLASTLTIDDCLALIRDMLAEAATTALSAQLTENLDALGLRDKGVESWPLSDGLGVQIWDLTGTEGRTAASRYEGMSETRSYAWELSALLSFSSDHVLEDGLWRDRTRDQVFQEVSSGFSFFGDHMVFVNGSCCLEITHLPAWLRDRSKYRLQSYGYDSSSLFVWTVAMLRSAVTRDLAERYRNSVANLVELEGMTYQEQTQYAREQFLHDALIDQLVRFRDALKEQRNRAFDEYVSTLRGDERTVSVLARDMEKANTLANNLASLRQQALQAHTNTLIGLLAAVLAVAQLPGIVNQFAEWARDGEWGLVIGTSVGIVATLGFLPLVLRPLVRRLLG